ncbi:MAG TPA: SDR family oxidoreductase [Chitinophagaceae bacterium]|nr:SDR family oxidoreductase [Chitinophagaceae bacterium]
MNKIALVTGGSRGLGKNMALRLADYGHDVVITYHSQEEAAKAVVEEIEGGGRKAAAIQYDASDIRSLDNFIGRVSEILKSKWNTEKFDFLVNNAGTGATIPFLQATEADFDNFMNIHFKSVFFLTQKSLGLMNDGGRIINISTGTTRFSNPGYSIYGSMKAAIEVLTKYIAKEIGKRNITVNVVAPGPVATDFNNGGNRDHKERREFMASVTALGRVGIPEDIGGVVAFLCSEDARWINGQRIEVSGGMNL